MTGRERVAAAFDHVEPDRVPWFEQAFASDVASELLGRPVSTGCTMLHWEEAVAWSRGEEAHAAWAERVYWDTIALARELDHDLISPPWRMPQRPARQVSEYEYLYGDPAGTWELWRYHPGAGTYFRAERQPPVPDLEPDDLRATVEAVERWAADYVVPVIGDDHWAVRYQRDCPDLESVAPGALAIPYDPPVWLMACRLRPDLIGRYLDAMTHVAILDATAWAARGFRIVWGGGDFADNHGPMFGPQVFRDVLLPRVQHYVAALHNLGLKYVYRTDGNLWSIADAFFVESGIDGFGEIDVGAGMTVPAVRARYPHITCWGDVPCGTLLHQGTAEQVYEFTRRRLDECRGAGGWILGSSNSIVPGTPAANVAAMRAALMAG